MSQKKGDSFKKLRAYFIYNSLSVVVEIPNDKSCYHTFDASYHNHQTSVPFVETDTHIIFNDESTFIFAWGNGKSERRQWMEDRGFVCNGRATNALITDFSIGYLRKINLTCKHKDGYHSQQFNCINYIFLF